MKDLCYIVVSEYGIERMTKRPASLKRGELAVRVKIEVPDKCFTDPAIDVSVDVPETAIIRPAVLVEVEDASDE